MKHGLKKLAAAVSLAAGTAIGISAAGGLSMVNVVAAETISAQQAKSIAFSHAGVSQSDAFDIEVELDKEKGITIYEVSFETFEYEYEYDIDASNGNIMKSEKEPNDAAKALAKRQQAAANNSKISVAISRQDALTIALKDAGLSEGDVYDIEVDFDTDKGINKFEVEFETDDYEYEYDINAADGSIIKSEKEVNRRSTRPDGTRIKSSADYLRFDDVQDRQSAFYDSIYWAADNGITTGITPERFGQDDDCTRGQIVTFLWRANGKPEPKDDLTSLKDVDKDSAFYKSILWAEENGITTGFEDDTFRQDDKCTRGQIVTFLYRNANQPKTSTSDLLLSDVHDNSAFYDAIKWASETGVTTGYEDGTFRQDNTCTRGQGVTFLYRLNK